MNYAVDTHGRDLVPGKGSSVEGEALLSTYSALVEPCTAAKRINEILDWIGVKKEERDITITIRDSGMEYSMMSMDDNTVGFLIDSISSVPDLLLRLTTLKPGDGAAGVNRIFFERAKEGRRFAPKTEAKLEKVAGLTEAMERLRSATKTAQVWQDRTEEMLTKAGIIGADGRDKLKSVATENTSDGQTDGAKVIALEDLSRERPRKYEARVIQQGHFGHTQASEDAGIALMIEDGWEVMCVSTCPKFGAKTYYLRRQLSA